MAACDTEELETQPSTVGQLLPKGDGLKSAMSMHVALYYVNEKQPLNLLRDRQKWNSRGVVCAAWFNLFQFADLVSAN
jgi:hypothetical protein